MVSSPFHRRSRFKGSETLCARHWRASSSPSVRSRLSKSHCLTRYTLPTHAFRPPVVCPCAIGFASVIYAHPAFAPALPLLTKLVFLSSVTHQLVICALSPLPFAIAQVQDAGLLFLSSMATAIVTSLGPGVPLHERLATVVVHLSVSTALVGCGLLVIGRARLASLVQYLPSPVIGGYLAFIGLFMVRGGVSLSTGVHLAGLSDWEQLVTEGDSGRSLLLLAPALLAGLFLSALTSRFPRHFSVLFPVCLVAMPIAFYLVLWLSGVTMDDARAAGFLLSPPDQTAGRASTSLLDAYRLFDLRAVHWSAMFPSQLLPLASMLVTIAFGSSLDIASISMGTGCAVDYDQQLQTVGASNVVSGLVGGVTGSYIFSQTLINHRFRPAGDDLSPLSRLSGLSLAMCELSIAALPFPLMSVLPKFLFGAVMVFIGVELLKTWLGPDAFRKLLLGEYLTALGTFLCLNALGVQLGLAAGVALAALAFLVEYARAQTVRVVHKTSNVIRNAEQHRLLYSSDKSGDGGRTKQQAVVTVELQGHIFFGSATRIQNVVKRAVLVRSQSVPARPRRSTNHFGRCGGGSVCSTATTVATSSSHSNLSSHGDEYEHLPLVSRDAPFPTYGGAASDDGDVCALETLDGTPATERRGCEDRSCFHATRTRFVVFDFSRVSGVDATAARACFLALKVLLDRAEVSVVYCGMRPRIEALLRANGVLPLADQESDHVYESFRYCRVVKDLDLALDWCEQQLIADAAWHLRALSIECGTPLVANSPSSDSALSLAQVLNAYLDRLDSHIDMEALVEELASHFHLSVWQPHAEVFALNEPADAWFVLLSGRVELFTPVPSSPLSASTVEPSRGELVGRVRPGCVFGDMDFVLRQPRVVTAVATAPSTLVARMDRRQMCALRPALVLVLHQVLLRASVMTVNEKLHSLAI